MLERRFLGNTGLRVPVLGFGGAPIGNLYRAISDEQASDAISAAMEAGINYFDTAPFYGFGLSERRLGQCLQATDHASLAISTKVGRLLQPIEPPESDTARHAYCSPEPYMPVFDYSYDGVMRSFEGSCERLGVTSVDVLLMHDLGEVTHGDRHEDYFSQAMEGGYRALSELRNAGQVSVIGLGVNEIEICEQALRCADLDCILLAGRYTLLEQAALDSLIPACASSGISLIVGGPYNSGILALGTKTGGSMHYNYERAPDAIVARVRRIEEICLEFDVNIRAAALQFPLACPTVASVIPGFDKRDFVQDALENLGMPIPHAFWSELRDQALIRQDAPVPGGPII